MTDVVIDPLELVDPARYGQRGYPHELWARMRAEAPVAYIEPPDLEPFWAITKHADVQQVAAQPLRFSSARGIMLRRPNQPDFHSDVLVVLDPPRHGPLRRVASPRFTPKAMRARRDDIERIAVDLVDDMVAGGAEGEVDFVDRIAAPFPLAVIAWTLGVPRDDVGLLHRWTNEVIGKNDPEYRREGESPGQTIKRARGELHAYFGALVEERRREPQDDLVTELVAVRHRRDAAHRGGAGLLLRAPGRGRQRDHPQRDQRGPPGPHRAPRRVGEAPGRSRARPRRRRGDPALGQPDQPLHPHGDRGHRGPRRDDPRR